MNTEARLRRLEAKRPGKYQIFLTSPGREGYDAEGWAPGDREACDAAIAAGKDVVTIINITERKVEIERATP